MASRELAPAAVADLTADFAATTICFTGPGRLFPESDFFPSDLDAVPLLGLAEVALLATVVARALIVGVDLLAADVRVLPADLPVVLAPPLDLAAVLRPPALVVE